MIISSQAEGLAIRELMRETTVPLRIERKARGEAGDFYLATIEGIDVYGADFEPRKAWLFSPYLLQTLQYAAMNGDDHILRVSFQPGEISRGLF